MFEDALVESAGRLSSKSRYWMILTFTVNAALLAVMILVPLLHPEALPRTALTAILTAPPPPPPPAAPAHAPVSKAVKAAAPLNAMTAPTRVPHSIDTRSEAPPPVQGSIVGATMSGETVAKDGVFGGLAVAAGPVVVTREPERLRPAGPIHVSSGVAAGALLVKVAPLYPAIAKAAHVSGAVVLRAVISTSGAIESLQVVSGPEMLRASALDAVRQWRYRPYLLNGEPTAVDTTVTVNFSFGG